MADHSNGSSNIPPIRFTKLFINGHFVDSISGKTMETMDPRTGEVIVRVSDADSEDVDLAVKAARHAFDHGPWPRFSGSERGRMMMKLADMIEENVEEIAALDAINGGKLFSLCKLVDMPVAANTLRYYAGAADKVHGTVLKLSKGLQGYTLREPIGVVGCIIPWNFPSIMFFTKAAPALAAGCTLVIKPAEHSPLSALFFAHLSKLAGIPDGVINVVNGFGDTAGAAISSHMGIDKVTFTGSTEVGRKIMMAAAASNLKPVTLELGGKSPLLIFDDADVDEASDIAFNGVFFNKGEICIAGSRVYVQEGIYDKIVNKLVEKANAWVVGDPLIPGLIKDPRGYYIQPTIFADVEDDMIIAKEEIFGPVMSLMKFKTMEEAIKRANSTVYGLAAGVITKNLNVANTVSRSVRAGIVWINCYTKLENDCPYGGYKMSGFGRDSGLDSLYQFLQIKSVVTPIHDSPWH
ncbi:Retinal dehydrogenase 1 [Hibiscus syriacus]|uniref:aldehyde dehydrogenase (NAD(+)) n=1 Tax=Hibiscus syriacus TaxID=106335 RepID=A0A6A3BUW2_HIBSY|nr:Retinal dehydrogenase 1 [Hibiscus syriacus]